MTCCKLPLNIRAVSIFVFLSLLSSVSSTWAQTTSENFGLLGFNFGFSGHVPAGDLSERFGNFLGFGSDLDYFTPKNSIILGLSGRFFFGSQVEEDPIAILRDPLGNVAAPGQGTVPVFLRMRGLYMGAHAGKLFQLGNQHKKSNLRATIGAGLLQHKIRIQDESDGLLIFSPENRKGFDRLSNGLAFTQQIGYQRINRASYTHFYVGLEFMQAFTQGRRDVDIQSQAKMEETRVDLMISLRAAWTLPIYYTSDKEETYFY